MQPTTYEAENLQDFARVVLQRAIDTGVEERNAQFEKIKRALIQDKCTPLDRARTIAAMVVADHEAKGSDTRIDIDRSTSTCVFVTVDGERHALTVPQIEAIVRGHC